MLTVITGCMFSGKSERLISLAMSYVIAGRNVVAFKPSNDTRYDAKSITTHYGLKFPSIVVPKDEPFEIFEELRKWQSGTNTIVDVVVIDEAQFFSEHLIGVVEGLLYKSAKTVILSGLAQDSEGRPFGAMPHLLAIADDIIHLKAVCASSKTIGGATRTYRKDDDSSQILVGGVDKYEPRSFKEWLK